ncbi:2,3-diaminopropionate biosynthesis protein SbnB [Paenibacillus sp. GSMTC-2017]|uniref:2,3-diaminopropionate biosynthesis protein SbnB n=1 Tax=Paenibacillus sp. GSMTC-2017 TaxID=2794350 RepID=UPI001E3BAF46|nr:2,3-diaminopropionate biosynthesis protein SbnB [Paenibacillus sp. GSMTC-2017]
MYLSREEIVEVGGSSSTLYVEAITNALSLHAQGKYVQPLKPYLRTQDGNGHIADRIIAMPAHLSGDDAVSGIKWIGSKHDNPVVRGLERASGIIVLNDPESNYPIAVMEAGLISSMRTAAVTVVAARHLAKSGFQFVTCLGCGYIAKAQLYSLLQQFESIEVITLFDVNKEAAVQLASILSKQFNRVDFKVADSAEEAIRSGEVIVTCTVTDTPYIPFEWIPKGAFVSNVSIMDVQKDVFLLADKVVVDDWDQSNREKKIINQLVLEGSFSREGLHAELGEIIIGRKPGRENDDEIIILNPMGMAIEDIACAKRIYMEAELKGLGTRLDLY